MRSRKPPRIEAMVLLAVSLLAGCTSSEQPGTGRVPLADAWPTMKPTPVWEHFYELTQVPRKSKHEEKATALVADFGWSLGLETVVDAVGNVIIRKPATKGMEGSPGVVLQSHLDMVAKQTTDSTANMDIDPIQAYVEEGWVRADGTTLGADDGIGVAVIMAILGATDVVHGPLEALFTVDEEEDFTGIDNLGPDTLTGRVYINVDNELEGQFIISSAGGVYVLAREIYEEVATPAGMAGFLLTVDGLLGGHSGLDIDKGRGSAHQIMARLLVEAPSTFDVRIAEVVGGDQRNAIPSTTTAVVALPSSQSDAFGQYVKDFGATVASELAATDPGVTVTMAPTGLPARVMEPGAQQALVRAVYEVPQGVYKMSSTIPDLVETSGNLGVLGIAGGQFTADSYVRSAIDSERDAEAERFAAVFEDAGATVTLEGAFSSWPPDPDSPLLALMSGVYADTFGTPAAVDAVHAGLETSVAGVTYPGMDMISIGATTQGVHTPEEQLEVASVTRLYDLLVATLRNVDCTTIPTCPSGSRAR
jgi:dipeptidase D